MKTRTQKHSRKYLTKKSNYGVLEIRHNEYTFVVDRMRKILDNFITYPLLRYCVIDLNLHDFCQ